MSYLQNDEKPKKFDTTVTYRDEKTGLVVKTDPYILRVIGDGTGAKTRLWERPAGSGNLFDSKGQPAGRWVIDAKSKQGSHQKDAEHIAFVPPETDDQKLARSLLEKDTKIAELERELKSIQAEKDKSVAKKQDKGS